MQSQVVQNQTPRNTGNIENPWVTFDSPDEAEEFAGFVLGISEATADPYRPVSFSVMKSEKKILEAVYQDGDYEVVVRKSPGEGQDISGIYGFENTATVDRNGVVIKIYRPDGEFETPNAVLSAFDYNGYSWSLYAPNGYWGDSAEDFWIAILDE